MGKRALLLAFSQGCVQAIAPRFPQDPCLDAPEALAGASATVPPVDSLRLALFESRKR